MFCTASLTRLIKRDISVFSSALQDTVEQDISWLMVVMPGSDTEALLSLIRLVDLLREGFIQFASAKSALVHKGVGGGFPVQT